MLVKAFGGAPGSPAGYYDLKRRYEGEVFKLLNEKDFSKTWMEKLDESEAPKKAKPQAPVARPGRSKDVI